jgi:hypothetical protein
VNLFGSWAQDLTMCLSRTALISLPSRSYARSFSGQQPGHPPIRPTRGVMLVDPSGRGEDKASDAVLKFPHGRVFLVSSGRLLRGYDDKTPKALVAISKKHEIKLIL